MAHLKVDHVSVPVVPGKERTVADFFVTVLGFQLDREVGEEGGDYFAQFVTNGIDIIQIAGDKDEPTIMSPVHIAFRIEEELWTDFQEEIRIWCSSKGNSFALEDIGNSNFFLRLDDALFSFEFMIR